MKTTVFSTVLCIVFSLSYSQYTRVNLTAECLRYSGGTQASVFMNNIDRTSLILEASNKIMPAICTVTVVPPTPDSYVMLKVDKFKRPSSSSCGTFILIDKNNICGEDKRYFNAAHRGNLKFQFYVDRDGPYKPIFRIYANSFKYSPCFSPWDFRCDNGKCISSKLVKDGVNNCGDNSDEKVTIKYLLRDCIGGSTSYTLDKENAIALRLVAIAKPMLQYCTVRIHSPSFDTRISLAVEKNVEGPADCGTYIRIGEEAFCKLGKKHYYSENPSVSFDFRVARDLTSTTAFKVYVTSFRHAPCSYPWDFQCKNKRCISSKLVKDGINNCGDGSDEKKDGSIIISTKSKRGKTTKIELRGLSKGAIIGICVGVIVAVVLVAVIVKCLIS